MDHRPTPRRPVDALLGSLVADALAMPVHWYYDRAALVRDYGELDRCQPPRNPHPDSILWRSSYQALNPRGEILHDQAAYWGQRGVHYHQFLVAGENTLNFQLARLLYAQIRTEGGYDPDRWLATYQDFMLTPGRHRDTYVEECHRAFFTNLARGLPPRRCGGEDIHIGGLAAVPALFAALVETGEDGLRQAVQAHVGLTHRHPKVLAAADTLARLLSAVAQGEDIRPAVERLATDWVSPRRLAQWAAQSDLEVIGAHLSPACYIVEAFPAALYLTWKYADDFAAGIRANAQVGGDSCHRGAVVGGLLGLALGVPEAWQAQLNNPLPPG
ncbi:MAG: ADP-ribosylglycohydrolase family protein [Thiobacillaceae bacterium]|jgi:ADP-ribosylglycohydrolase|nr:ADP-ribosylglycohydrolase family protein [Thiobacillaceae bacterium]